MITPGTPVIINETDAPHAECIAIVEKFDPKTQYVEARYLCENNGFCAAPIECLTPIVEFGVKIHFTEEGTFTVEQVGASTAHYRDGEPRSWRHSPGWFQYDEEAFRLYATNLEITPPPEEEQPHRQLVTFHKHRSRRKIAGGVQQQ